MKILSVNAGSSSLKFTMFEMPEEKVIINGTFEKIGLKDSFYSIKYNGEKTKKEAVLNDHTDAVKILLEELINYKVIESYDEINGVGHRVLHGGSTYFDSIVVDEAVKAKIEELFPLGPLHNPANLAGIRSFEEILPNTPQVAVFDTAFHQTMAAEQYLYAVPYAWYENFGVRKYGFHGTSHRYIAAEMNKMLGKDAKIISCHIGNGASLCAIKDGKCVDTSMGFTPLAGLIMGSRSGDIDASIIPYIMEKTNKTAEEVVTELNKKSGMLAVSGVSSDMREIEEGYLARDPRCIAAMDAYAGRICDYISMYNTELEGAEYIVFTAGVGENSDILRKMVADRFSFMGIKLDEEKNSRRGISGVISTDDSTIKVVVLGTDEEVMIARDTFGLIEE